MKQRKWRGTVKAHVAMKMSERYWALVSPPEAQRLHVVIIGCGAIGSNAAIALAKLGVKNFTLWDIDTVEGENVGVQAYDATHLGELKVDALADVLDKITAGEARVSKHSSKFTPRTRLPRSADVVIASLDNIPTREAVWARTKELPTKKHILYIDPRMAAELFDVKATVLNEIGRGFNKKTADEYERSFHKDVPPAPCGMVSTPYCAMACGAAVAATVKRFVSGEPIRTWTVMDVSAAHVMKGEPNDATFASGGGAGKDKAKRASRPARSHRSS